MSALLEDKQPTTGPSTSSAKSKFAASLKYEERLNKIKELQLKRNEARKLNHAEVVEEDRRKKLPENWQARKERAEWILDNDEKQKKAKSEGYEYDRVKRLEVTAEDADRWDRMRRRKQNPDKGFSSYEDATVRQYDRLTKQMKPDMDEYETQKATITEEDFYASSESLYHGCHKPSEKAVDRLVDDVHKQIDKRGKYSRRRKFNDDDDIDYINERNAKFNKKAERFFGKYTAEIKQNLERGTAV